MRRSPIPLQSSHRQAGAALVVGLLLLLVLTILAISGVNSSSLNLLMAGNTQYSQNAFQAAESGIETAIAKNKFNPDPSLAPETQEKTTEPKSVTVSKTQLCGMPQPPLAGTGTSYSKSSTYHFEIESTGQSKRGATARNVQAIAVISPADAVVSPAATCGGGGGVTKLE